VPVPPVTGPLVPGVPPAARASTVDNKQSPWSCPPRFTGSLASWACGFSLIVKAGNHRCAADVHAP
jgi:hypothetical protein